MSVDLAILWLTFLPALGFTTYYGLMTRWWRYQEGTNVLLLGLFLTLLTSRSLLLRYDAEVEPPASWYLRVIVLGIAAVMWWRWWLLLRAQAEARREER